MQSSSVIPIQETTPTRPFSNSLNNPVFIYVSCVNRQVVRPYGNLHIIL